MKLTDMYKIIEITKHQRTRNGRWFISTLKKSVMKADRFYIYAEGIGGMWVK
jgi:hypothetical protein